MQLDRRAVLVGGAAAIGLCHAHSVVQAQDWQALAVADETPPVLPESLRRYSDQDSLNGAITDYQPFGTHPPTSQERILAQRVLDGVPRGGKPIDVALYFLDVGAGRYGEALRPYVTAWPVRWNPVIVEFFAATNTRPSGDTTAWCAAFMNYCLIKASEGNPPPAGSAEPTLSAASRSFRSWSSSTEAPRPGDVVVFRRKDSPGQGHVGFFLSETGSSVLVLGGNQFEGRPTRHTINRKSIAKDGSILALHSYHTDPQLHA
jgi:uncharacterized protein (TIGR02594 family)